MSSVDIPKRLGELGADYVHFNRLAITEVDAWKDELPSFDVRTKGPTDESKGDSRYRWWTERGFGLKCYELDALNPVELRARVQHAIEARIDWGAWKLAEVTESAELDSLKSILSMWPGRACLATISGQATECVRDQD